MRCCASRSLRRQGAGGEGESGPDGHHLGMHGERGVGVVANSFPHGLKRHERPSALLIILLIRLRFRLTLWLILQTLLQLRNGRPIKSTGRQNTRLESPPIEAMTISIEALPDHLATSNNDGTVAVVQGRKFCLGEAQSEEGVVAAGHFAGVTCVGV